jgi:hypothetical protein
MSGPRIVLIGFALVFIGAVIPDNNAGRVIAAAGCCQAFLGLIVCYWGK